MSALNAMSARIQAMKDVPDHIDVSWAELAAISDDMRAICRAHGRLMFTGLPGGGMFAAVDQTDKSWDGMPIADLMVRGVRMNLVHEKTP